MENSWITITNFFPCGITVRDQQEREKGWAGRNPKKEQESSQNEEEERSDGSTGCADEEQQRRRACSRPCRHTYSRTVQAADINNSLLIFICSGESWVQSNPNSNHLSTCLCLGIVPRVRHLHIVT